MHSLRGIAILALAAGALVGLAGAGVLRLLRGRSIIVHVVALITITVAVVVAGVVAVAQAMFLSHHDLNVVLITVGVAALVSLVVGVTFGRRLAAAAMWARQAEQVRRDLVAWVSHDLRTPLAGLRAMSEALEDAVVSEPEAVAEYHRRISAETDRMSGLVDDGTVHVAAGTDHDMVRLTVSDTCGGIPAEDLPRVFDVAFRGSRERTEGGGLGLPIVRGLLEAQAAR